MDKNICRLGRVTGYSLAQLLPQHILETIVDYVKTQSPESLSHLMIRSPPIRLKALVPLTSVCRSWRYATNLLLYHTAALIIGRTSLSWSTKHIIMLEDVAHSSSLCHVKNIYLSIDILELLDLSNNDLRLMSTLHNYGKLTGVRSTEIFFEHDSDKSTTSFNQKSNSILTAATIKMLKKIEIFAITLHNFMPNVKRISVDKAFFDGRIGDGQLHIGVIISLIFNQICPEYGPISSISMTIDRFSTAGPGDIALQKIILFNARLEQDAEIIRRNSNTLEVLTICGEHYTDAISEILGYDGVSFHITYSQLKHLQLDVSVPAHSQPPPEPRKPLALDPFPRLVTLIYHGVFPLHSLLAMNEISPHIRHLEVIMDSKLVWLSSQNQVLGSRSLANIDYLSLTWSLEAFNNVRGEPCTLVSRFIEQCTNIRVLRFSRVFHICIGVNGFISHTNFPATLRILDASVIRLTIHQAIALLCSCPQVQKVCILLTDLLDNPRHEIPSPAEISTFQSCHRSNTACTQFLGINFVSFRSPRKAAEFTVLLTDVIGSITRVCIIPESEFAKKVSANIVFALVRPPYKDNTRLHKVQFELSCRW